MGSSVGLKSGNDKVNHGTVVCIEEDNGQIIRDIPLGKVKLESNGLGDSQLFVK